MPSIHKRNGLSRDYYFVRVPTDVRDKALGRLLIVDFPLGPFDPALTKPVKIGRTHLRVALETRHPETARVRHQIVGVAAARLYKSIRRGPEVLSQRRLTAVSRLAYDRFIALAGDNPGGEKRWTDFLAWSHAIRTGSLEFSMRVWPDDLPEEVSSAEQLPTEPSKAWDIESGMEMRFGAMAIGPWSRLVMTRRLGHAT